MEVNPYITVIIPIYNTEKYLCSTLESIRKQSYANFEAIMINDGSTDNSGLICKKYVEKDPRFKYLYQPNAGVSASRNVGLINAAGKYVQFVDADDTIEHNMLEIMLNSIYPDFDLVICNYNVIDQALTNKNSDDKEFNKLNTVFELNKDEFMNTYFDLKEKVNLVSCFNKMYKFKVIKDNQLIFNENYSHGEDAIFNLSYFYFLRKIKIIPERLYNYRKRNISSLSEGFRKNFIDGFLSREDYVLKFLKDNNIYYSYKNKYQKKIPQVTNKMLSNIFHKESDLNFFETLEEIKKIIKSNWVNEHSDGFRQSNFILKVIGYLIKTRQTVMIYIVYFLLTKARGIRYKLRTLIIHTSTSQRAGEE